LRSMGDPTAAKDSSAYMTFQGISDDGTTVDGYVNSPEAVQAATIFQSMFGPNAITPKTGTPNAFLNGKAAFDINLYQESVDLAGKKKGKFNWGIAPMPYFKTPLVHTGSDTIGVSAKTKHPEEAAAYALFATSKAEQEKFFKNGGTPILKDFYKDSPVFQKYPVKIFADELDQWGQPRPTSPAFAQYDDQMTTALNNIALGADPKATLDEAARKIDKQLQSVR
jgi:fructooligosaccharide transport system substrate-binding protein